jgi:uncharacterized membrane protein YkvA (DUF1232 family)
MSGRHNKMRREDVERYYDRVRERIHSWLQGHGRVAEKTGDFLLLVPDVFLLLWRLVNDARVNGRNKVLLGSGIVYFVFPFDLIPEALVGPIGYLDDLVFAVYILNKMLTDTDPAILREHWSGHEDILESIRKVLSSADSLFATNVLGRLKRMMGR